MSQNLKYALSFDEHGHFEKMEHVQIVNGLMLLPADGQTVFLEKYAEISNLSDAGIDLSANYVTLNAEKNDIVVNPYPKSAAECVGIFIKHDDNCTFNCKMRELFDELTAKDDNYQISQDESLCKTVIKKPAKTEAEIEADKSDAEIKQFDEQIKELKDSMALAMLSNDQELIKELQSEYATLTEGA